MPSPLRGVGLQLWVHGSPRTTNLEGFSQQSLKAGAVFSLTEYDRFQLRLLGSGRLKVEGFEREITPGQAVDLVGPAEVGEPSWFPGSYALELEVGGQLWHGLFEVQPKHVGWAGLNQMKADLEAVATGLSLVSEGLGRQGELQLLASCLAEVEPAVLTIAAQPQSKLVANYDVVPIERARRLDSRSLRWLGQGQWVKHSPSKKPRHVLAPSAVGSLDTFENRVMKTILTRFGERAQQLGDSRLAQGFATLGAYLPEAEAGGPLVPTQLLLADSRYRLIYRWFRRLFASPEVAARRTSSLYEYWAVVQIMGLLEGLGFCLVEGDLTAQVRRLNWGRPLAQLPPGATFELRRGPQRLRVVYDQPLPHTAATARDGLWLAAAKNRPDLRLDLFDGPDLQRCLVIDAKYRRAAAIWSQLEYTSTMQQLQAYAYNLFCGRRPVTWRALAVYPGSEGVEVAGEPIGLLPLTPGRAATELRQCLGVFLGAQA